MARKSQLRAAGDAASEWAGARVVAPFPITGEGEPYFPDISMWLDLPSGLVLASRVHGRGRKDGGLASLLEEAMSRPLAGKPREPVAVRVPTNEDAARVRAVLPDGVPVRVAPVPEVASVVQQMADDMGVEGPELGWLVDEHIDGKALHAFFQGARALYLLAPWRTIPDTHILRFDVPEHGLRGACLSLFGQLGETLGFLAFPSVEHFDAFLLSATDADENAPPPDDSLAGCLSLTYERVSELPPEFRRKLTDSRWPIAGPKAFPYLERRGPDGCPLPIEDQDIRLAAALVTALVAFVGRHHAAMAQEDEYAGSISESFTSSGLAVTLSYPFDDDDLQSELDELDLDDELDDFDLEDELELDEDFDPDDYLAKSPACSTGDTAGSPASLVSSCDAVLRPGGSDASAGLPRTAPASSAAFPFASGLRAGRNDPCPCGSGKKYKKCHLASDERAAAGRAAPHGHAVPDTDALHDLDRKLVADLVVYAQSRFGKSWLRHRRDFAIPDAASALAPHWALYHYLVEGRPVAEWFEEERGRALSAAERRWIAAQRAAWLSVWEVEDVDPGRSLTLVDRLSGEKRVVVEKSASLTLTPRLLVLARVVTHGDVAVVAGIHSQPLRPYHADPVATAVRRRKRLRYRDLVPLESLREEAIGRLLIRRWEEQVAEMRRAAATPPVMHNTDGDELCLTVDVFDVDVEAICELERRIAAIDGVDEIEEPEESERSAFTLGRKARHGSGLGFVSIARVGLSDSRCTLEIATNSPARADEARALLAPALRGLANFRERSHPPGNPMARTTPGPRDVDASAGPATKPPLREQPEVQAAVRAFKARQYESWIDEEIPALGGLTPRAAAQNAKDRRRLDRLLRDMESMERRLPAAEQYDFNVLRRRLGLDG